MSVLAWIVAGLIGGWLAGQLMKGGGYGAVADFVLGMLGGFVGGWLLGRLLDGAERRRARSSITSGAVEELYGRPSGLQQGRSRLPASDW